MKNRFAVYSLLKNVKLMFIVKEENYLLTNF